MFAEHVLITTGLLLLAISIVSILTLVLAGIAMVPLSKTIREMRADQRAMFRVVANMDWTSVLSIMQSFRMNRRVGLCKNKGRPMAALVPDIAA